MSEADTKPIPIQQAGPIQSAASGRDILTVAGYGLIAYGLYSILITLLSGTGGPELVIQRIAQLVTLFPVLFLGPALLHAGQPSARRENTTRQTLIRWLVLVTALAYLAFIPLAFFTQFSSARADENVVIRQKSQLLKRRNEILASIAKAETPDQFRQALSQFPEISQINISPSDPASVVRSNIAANIDQGIRNEIERFRNASRSRNQLLAAVVRTAVLGSLVSGLAMMALALRIIPWLESLSRSTTHSLGELVNSGSRLFRRRSTANRRPGPAVQLQKSLQNLQKSLRKLNRRWEKQRRANRSKLRR